MTKKSLGQKDRSFAIYVNLLAAHTTLAQIRDHFRLLAQLTEVAKQEDPEALVRPEALTWCLASVARDLDEVFETVRWSAEASREQN